MKNFIMKIGNGIKKAIRSKGFRTILIDGVLVTIVMWGTSKILDYVDDQKNKKEGKKEDRVVINAEVVELHTEKGD